MNKSSRWLSLSAWLVYAFLYIPLFIVVLFSFNTVTRPFSMTFKCSSR